MNERDMYTRLYANAQDTVLLLAPDSATVLFANPRASEDTSFDAEELIGLPFTKLFLPEDEQAIQTLLQTTVEWKAGTDPQRTLKRKSGKKIITEITTQWVPFEQGHAISCNIRDITARVKAEEELRKMNAELEMRVQQRTEELRRQKKELDDVMSHIQQGILTLGKDLKINPDFSAFTKDIFGDVPIAGQSIDGFLFLSSPSGSPGESSGVSNDRSKHLCSWMTEVFGAPQNWDLLSDFGPREIQYKDPLSGDTKDLTLQWKPIFETPGDLTQMSKLMLVVMDVTQTKKLQAELDAREEEHREELELIAQMLHISPQVVAQFVQDLKRFVDELQSLWMSNDTQRTLRVLHTIKGAARQMKLERLQSLAHQMEEIAGTPSDDRAQWLEKIQRTHAKVTEIYEKVVQASSAPDSDGLVIDKSRWNTLVRRAFRGKRNFAAPAIQRALLWLTQKPVSALLDRLHTEAKDLASELGKEIECRIECDGTSLSQSSFDRWHDALLHVIRNALDHGAELPTKREALQKPRATKLTFKAHQMPGDTPTLVIEIEDDGAGIDPERIRQKLIERNLPLSSKDDLFKAIFLPGFSTRDQVTDLSGRGVGLDVVRQLIELEWGGTISVHSRLGQGTKFIFSAPLEPTQVLRLEEHASSNPQPGNAQPGLQDGSTILLGDFQPKDILGIATTRPELLGFWSKTIPSGNDLRDRWSKAFLHSLSAPTLEDWLGPQATMADALCRDYALKETYLEAIRSDFSKAHFNRSALDSLMILTDELFMNAFYNAPVTPTGVPKYAHLPRSQPIQLESHEQCVLEWGHSDRWIGVSIEDPFGRLERNKVWSYFEKGFRKHSDQIDSKPGGAGLGLYFLLEAAPVLSIDTRPGFATRVTVLFPLLRSYEEIQTLSRCFLLNTASVISS